MKKEIKLGRSPYEKRINESIEIIKKVFSVSVDKYGFPQIAVMCGTSGPFTKEILDVCKSMRVVDCISYRSLKFPVPSVSGHDGSVSFALINDAIPVLICSGRVHYFEGLLMDDIVFSTRALACFGIKTFILTNASGSLDSERYQKGDIVVIEDHVNCLGDSPLRGEANAFKEFTDMTNAYSPRLLKVYSNMVKLGAYEKDKRLGKNGIYIATPGREFETPAEVRKRFAPLGDLIGMSTVPEVIAGRQMGCEMFGISLVTNLAAGLSSDEVSHEENLDVVQSSAPIFSKVLIDLVLAQHQK